MTLTKKRLGKPKKVHAHDKRELFIDDEGAQSDGNSMQEYVKS